MSFILSHAEIRALHPNHLFGCFENRIIRVIWVSGVDFFKGFSGVLGG